MSLKIWLPLDGDLRNLGCSRAQIINNGATIDNNGKIGKCYNFDGESQYLQITNFTVDAWPQMTIMFWSNNGPKSVFTLKSGTTSTGNMQFRSTSNSHFYFRDKQHSTETQVALTTTIAANVWAHYAFIYNNGSWRAYINGVLSGEFNAETPTTLNNNNQVLWICNGSTASSSVFKSGKINDFRLYDSALSAAEVHEIAQGLVLHYKLEGPMGGSGINLLQGSNKIGDSNNYGWIQNGSYTDFSIEKLEGNIIHYRGTISNNKYIPSITTNIVAPCEFGKTYTYQMELKFDKDITLSTKVPMHFWAGCRNTDNITNVSCNGNLTSITYSFVQNHSGTLTANTWVKIITQITFPSAATTTGYDYPAIRAFVYGGVLPETYTGEVNVWMRNCKIEEGTVATNWSFAPEDLGIDTTIVEDSSGYGHNGEIINSITLQADSPRYSKSMHFSATNQKIKISNFPTSGFGDSYTFAWWGKTASTTPMQWGFRDGIRLNGMYQGKLWNTGDASSNPIYIPGTTTQVTAPTTGVWHHYVMTGDGNTCKVYLDGVFWGQAKTYKSISGTTIYINGWDETTSYASSNFSISDFRIYCTALLDTDIKLLYNMGSRIDNLGGVHSFELNEKDNNLLAGTLITSAYGNRTNPYTKYNSNGEMYFDANGTSAGSNYIPINPTNHTYYYDFDISVNTGNQLDIGFERYDVNKTNRSNNATIYIYAAKSTEDINHKHIFGTVDLSTDGVNPCAFIRLRILNGWSGTTSGVVGTATIHSMSLREISNIQNPKSYKNGILLTGEFKEYQKASFYKNGFVEATEFIEI